MGEVGGGSADRRRQTPAAEADEVPIILDRLAPAVEIGRGEGRLGARHCPTALPIGARERPLEQADTIEIVRQAAGPRPSPGAPTPAGPARRDRRAAPAWRSSTTTRSSPASSPGGAISRSPRALAATTSASRGSARRWAAAARARVAAATSPGRAGLTTRSSVRMRFRRCRAWWMRSSAESFRLRSDCAPARSSATRRRSAFPTASCRPIRCDMPLVRSGGYAAATPVPIGQDTPVPPSPQ